MPRIIVWRDQEWCAHKLGVCLSQDGRFLRRDGVEMAPIYLSPGLAAVMAVLARVAPAAVVHDRMITAIWGSSDDIPEAFQKGMQVRVCHLRKLIAAHWRIDSLHDLGYRLAALSDPTTIITRAARGSRKLVAA